MSPTFVEQYRVNLRDCHSYQDCLSKLMKPLKMDYYDREIQARIRVPIVLKREIIKEMNDDYKYTPFGDLSSIFREMAEKHWGLYYAGAPIILDPSISGCMILDVLVGYTKKRRGRPPMSLARALQEA